MGESIQLNGRIRRSRTFEAFPCQPQLGFSQETSSSPNISIASVSDMDSFLHFRCKLMLWPLGHSRTNRYALLMAYSSTFGCPWLLQKLAPELQIIRLT